MDIYEWHWRIDRKQFMQAISIRYAKMPMLIVALVQSLWTINHMLVFHIDCDYYFATWRMHYIYTIYIMFRKQITLIAGHWKFFSSECIMKGFKRVRFEKVSNFSVCRRKPRTVNHTRTRSAFPNFEKSVQLTLEVLPGSFKL